MDSNLHSLSRHLVELRIEHADLNALVDGLVEDRARDDLPLQRLKKRRLPLRDRVRNLELLLYPSELA